MALILGLDAGGTSSRAVLATADGERVGSGRGGGANPTVAGVAVALAQLRAVAQQALHGTDPAGVAGAVVGIAGQGALADPAGARLLERMWTELGLTRPPRVVPDPLIAYCSATPEPTGTVLLAGTGAAAAAIEGFRMVQVADGHGWLLGDEGSGFWLGRAAAKVTVRQVLAGEPGVLAQRVVAQLAGPGADWSLATVDAISALAQQAPVPTLAPLAPLVSEAAAAGDPAAGAIVRTAADHLVATAERVRGDAGSGPIVLAGSVLTVVGPVRAAVEDRCARRWAAPVLIAGDPAGGAAWLAARELAGWSDTQAAALHRRLCRDER